MDDSKQSSAWDELASELGAQPPADADQRRRPAVQFEFERPAEPEPENLPAPRPGDWAGLAGELGIEVPPEPEPAAATPTAAKDELPAVGAIPEGDADDFIVEDEAEQEPIEQGESPDDEPALQQAWLIEEPGEGDILHHDEVSPDDSELAELSSLEDDNQFAAATEPSDLADADDDGLSGEEARNAFDALFEAGSFAALGSGFDSDEAEEARLGAFDDLGDESTAVDADRDDSEILDIDEGQDDDAAEDLSPADATAEPKLETTQSEDEGTEGDDDDAPRKRRRRRRRGGRGRGRGDRNRSETDEAESDSQLDDESADDSDSGAEQRQSESGDGDDENEEVGGERKRRRRRRGRRRKRSEGDDAAEGAESTASDPRTAQLEDDEFAEADDEDGEDGDRRRTRSPSHKNIPTWSDAVGVMVDVNLASRKANPGRGDGGRGRGRSRGGRRRNKRSS